MARMFMLLLLLSTLGGCAWAERPIPPGLETGIRGNGGDGGGGEDVVGGRGDDGLLTRVSRP